MSWEQASRAGQYLLLSLAKWRQRPGQGGSDHRAVNAFYAESKRATAEEGDDKSDHKIEDRTGATATLVSIAHPIVGEDALGLAGLDSAGNKRWPEIIQPPLSPHPDNGRSKTSGKRQEQKQPQRKSEQQCYRQQRQNCLDRKSEKKKTMDTYRRSGNTTTPTTAATGSPPPPTTETIQTAATKNQW